ncbi:MAG: 4Fe-4S binding protein [Kiritimatiellia bacterium]|jgi:MinD superfamily P-loop ATPase
MTLTIASGKGGTGKTTFSVNLAWALGWREQTKPEAERREIRLLDCDVEEPNGHLFVNPAFTDREGVTVLKPVWDATACTGCGQCAEACNYNAIAVVNKQVMIFNDLCHSCGVCAFVCPAKAIAEQPAKIGTVEAAPDHAPFAFAHGLLDIGEALSPKVVGAVKRRINPEAVNIIDAAPGTACSVVTAVEGSDAVLLVTEPTPFGLNDLKLAVGLALKLGVPTGIVVNRSDGEDRIIADYAKSIGLPIAGRIPFDRRYAEAYASGTILAERFPELRDNLLDIFDNLATACPPAPAEEDFALEPAPAEPFPKGAAEQHVEVTVISGKGGTGKTTVVASLAQLDGSLVLADNDVDAADLHLLLEPRVLEGHDFIGGTKCTIRGEACIACGRCADACHFDAIRKDGPANDRGQATCRINPLACEGCGLCARVCPAQAIDSGPNITGRWYRSTTACGPMLHARLGLAEENSGRLVSQVREAASDAARTFGCDRILGDGPPGTGCPVIASLSGCDLALMVTEPTVAGVHDLERVLRLAAHFGVPTAIVINKADLNAGQAARIEALAEARGATILGRIPFDRAVNDALVAGKTVVEFGDSPAKRALLEIHQSLKEKIQSP